MKSRLALIALLVLELSAGCGNVGGGVQIEHRDGKPANDLDQEVLKQTMNRWKMTKRGDSRYVCIVNKRDSSHSTRFVFEFRNLRTVVSPEFLSEADKLNGIQWRGGVNATADAGRSYCPDERLGSFGAKMSPDHAWSEWFANAGFGERLEKRNGKWKRGEVFVSQPFAGMYVTGQSEKELISFKKVEASDLPK